MEEVSTIYERMRAPFAREAGYQPSNGGDMMVRLYALSAEIQSLLAQADWVLEQSFPQTAQGQYLDFHAQERALTRGEGTRASGVLRFFSGGTALSDYEIPAGTVCMTADGIRFETTRGVTLLRGTDHVDTAARAMEPGVEGNAAAGGITLIAALPAGIVRCTNPAAFSGGSDSEDDESLRARILASYRRLPNGANAAYYEQAALSLPEVAAAKAVGRSRGIGTVDVYVASQAGVPSQELLGRLRDQLAEQREIAVDLRVLAPAEHPIDLSAKVKPREGCTASEVIARCERALRDYFTGARLGEPVLTAHLTALLYSVEGVENCALVSPSADIAVSQTELPTLRSISVTEMA